MKKVFNFSKQKFFLKNKHTTSIDGPRGIIYQKRINSHTAFDMQALGDQGTSFDPDNLVFGRSTPVARFLTMNNPRNYNRFDLRFCKAVKTQIEKFNHSPLCKLIVLRGGGSRSFSDGIDIFEIYDSVQKQDRILPIKLFREMYKTAFYISNISTPLITFINGSMTSGGAGIGAYSDYVLITDGSSFSVPECSYGFFPDNGNCYLLSKINEKYTGLGTFLALTGAQVEGEDLIHAGLATHSGSDGMIFQAFNNINEIEYTQTKQTIHDLILRHSSKVKESIPSFARDLKPIERCFVGKERVEDVVIALEKENSEWSRNVLEIFKESSPTSLQVTLRAMNEAQGSEMNTVYKNDYRISLRMIYTNDFQQGISKVFLSEDRSKPKWEPATLEEVSDEMINSFFKPLNLEENLTCDLNLPDEAFMGQAMEVELERKNIKI